jgi:hypothetical protein
MSVSTINKVFVQGFDFLHQHVSIGLFSISSSCLPFTTAAKS